MGITLIACVCVAAVWDLMGWDSTTGRYAAGSAGRVPLHMVEALDSGAFRAAGLELAAAMLTGIAAMPILAVAGHAVAKPDEGLGTAATRRVGVPVAARAMRMVGLPPVFPCGKQWEWVGALISLVVVVIGWDMVCGSILLGESPLLWLARFLSSCDDVSIQQWEDSSPDPSWWLGMAEYLRPVQALMIALWAPDADAAAASSPSSPQFTAASSSTVAPSGPLGLPPPTRLLVCALWAVAVPAQLLLAQAMARANAPQIVVRKLFHAAAALMLAPAIVVDPGLVAIAGAGALRFIVAAEVLRSAGTPIVSGIVGRAVTPFLDARDGGALVMTHIYLLCGCLLPVWLLPLAVDATLRHGTTVSPWLLWVLFPQAGILAVAVSDAAAAAYGRLAGRFHWNWAMPKTVEGTTAGAVASSMCVVLLALTVPVHRSGEVLWASWPDIGIGCGIAVLVSLHETFTSLIDNVATPVYAVALTAAVATLPQLSDAR